MATVIEGDLSSEGLGKIIKGLRDYADSLETKCSDLVKELQEIGVSVAKDYLLAEGAFYSGEALGSITGFYDSANDCGLIIAGGYCKYIEFGTGVRGLESSHPSAEYLAIAAWAYNSGGTIFTTKSGKVGWYYPTDDGGWRFTEGMESRPFMYQTAQWLARETRGIAEGVFRT